MLSLLHIENIAVISSADISFHGGFNVLTGETGAGKSIVIDAIGAIMGGRTSRDLIRTGSKSARVKAVFSQVPLLKWCEEQGIYPDENGELLLERTIQTDGKNHCRVNGQPVLVTQLRELGCQLLNIHGQHDGQQLMDERCHLEYLDGFGGLSQEVSTYAVAFEGVQRIRQTIRAIQMDEGEKARRLDTLQYQIQELERAELEVGEEERLSQRREVLHHAEKLTRSIGEALTALTGDDEQPGAAVLLAQAGDSLALGGRYQEELDALAQQAHQLRFSAEELSAQIRDMQNGLECYSGELDEVEGRLDVIYRLKKKYGSSVEEMLAYLERCRKEQAEIQGADDRLQRLEEELSRALEQARTLGMALSRRRRGTAEQMALRIQSELTQLDMPKVQFQVEFSQKDAEDGMDATGMDNVRFLMSANVGESLKPIDRIASGGELARIMLALKNALADNDQIGTMVFDEVDTGVSGRAAQKVAEKLFQVARNRQVLCVTHLPQIAAMGDVHFCVEKGEMDGRTYTAVEQLEHARRISEIARLTSGEHVTEAALTGAADLLQSALSYKILDRKGL